LYWSNPTYPGAKPFQAALAGYPSWKSNWNPAVPGDAAIKGLAGAAAPSV
jgi:hypothetical protein